jgi:hypothetical protein
MMPAKLEEAQKVYVGSFEIYTTATCTHTNIEPSGVNEHRVQATVIYPAANRASPRQVACQ